MPGLFTALTSRLLLMWFLAVIVCPTPAAASLVTSYVEFTASGFGTSAPTNPVTGDFTITFDPTQTYTNATTGITLDALNIKLDYALGFTYPFSQPDVLLVGGVDGDGNAANHLLSGSYDFILTITNFTTAPTFYQSGFAYSAGVPYMQYFASSGTVSVKVVPLPNALLFFGTGLLGLAGWRRFRKG